MPKSLVAAVALVGLSVAAGVVGGDFVFTVSKPDGSGEVLRFASAEEFTYPATADGEYTVVVKRVDAEDNDLAPAVSGRITVALGASVDVPASISLSLV